MRVQRAILVVFLLTFTLRAGALVTLSVSDPGDTGPGTLRDALTDAQTALDDVRIIFLPGITRITVGAVELPALNNPSNAIEVDGRGLVTIDGTTGSISGIFSITSDDCVIRGLTIINAFGSGVYIEANRAVVQGCIFGIDNGVAAPNGTGITMYNSDEVRIGGTGAGEGNIIGPEGNCIYLGEGCDNVFIEGNYCGLGPDGETRYTGLSTGIGMVAAATGISIGPGNVISGTGVGISLDGSFCGVFGNRIGTNAAGTLDVEGSSTGVIVRGSDNIVGLNGPGFGNVISGNDLYGINLVDAENASVIGNFIGLDVSGLVALPNGNGIHVQGAADGWEIGGTSPGFGNYVAGNVSNIAIDNSSGRGRIIGNAIGVNLNLLVMESVATYGVSMTNSSDITIGGQLSGMRNIIAGHWHALHLENSTDISFRGNAMYDSLFDPPLEFTNSNTSIAAPVITTAFPVAGTAPFNAQLDIFADDENEGRILLAATVADGTGAFNISLDLSAYEGMNLTATATVAKQTSQFSAPLAIPEFDDTVFPFGRCDDGAVFSQSPLQTPGVGYYSSDEEGLALFDDFDGLTAPIGALRWWGLDFFCATTSTQFRVQFHNDNGGVPAPTPVYTEQLVTTRTNTGAQAYDHPVYVYEAVLAEPQNLARGWISIVAEDNPGCSFVWLNGAGQNHYSYQHDTGLHAVDFSFCLVAGTLFSHDTDQNGDGDISLSELLRAIQFFNSNGFHCDPANLEDGFSLGPGDTSCPPYSADYAIPPNFDISLSELLRVIQLFNSIGYYACPGMGTEDGYCIGIP